MLKSGRAERRHVGGKRYSSGWWRAEAIDGGTLQLESGYANLYRVKRYPSQATVASIDVIAQRELVSFGLHFIYPALTSRSLHRYLKIGTLHTHWLGA